MEKSRTFTNYYFLIRKCIEYSIIVTYPPKFNRIVTVRYLINLFFKRRIETYLYLNPSTATMHFCAWVNCKTILDYEYLPTYQAQCLFARWTEKRIIMSLSLILCIFSCSAHIFCIEHYINTFAFVRMWILSRSSYPLSTE